MQVRLWGVRGSIPTPGSETVRYGGNTACVAVQALGETIILDAGSGVRLLGHALDAPPRPAPLRAHLLLTHVHWDHIQGFPFFAPAYREETDLDIYGLPVCHRKIDNLLSNQMEQIYFPVDLGSLRAAIGFHDLTEGAFELGAVCARTLRLNHTTETVGFRLEAGGRVCCYLPDNELALCGEPGRTSYDAFVRFCEGADLLIHDGQYTEETYSRHRGWGHSTRQEAVQLALDAGCRQVAVFHHDPRVTDAELESWERAAREELRAAGHVLRCDAAREGAVYDLAGGDTAQQA